MRIFARSRILLEVSKASSGSAIGGESNVARIVSTVRELSSRDQGSYRIPETKLIDSRFFQRCSGISPADNKICEQDSFLIDNGILAEDINLLPIEGSNRCGTIEELREALYGGNPYPILRPDLRCRVTKADPSIELRRQFVIERLVNSRSLVEYQLFAQSMANMGLLGNLQDGNVRSIWDSWMKSMTRRLTESLSGSDADAFHYKYMGAARKSLKLLQASGMKPETIATIVCVSVTSEVCNPSIANRPGLTGRGNGMDEDVFFSEMRKWTNQDIETSMSEGGHRVPFVHICNVVGSAVLFEANWKAQHGRKRAAILDWSLEDRLVVGSELLRMVLSECTMKLDSKSLMTGNESEKTHFEIDPQKELFSVSLDEIWPSQAPLIPRGVVAVPAFIHSVENRGFKATGYVSLRKDLLEILSKVVPRSSFFKLPPMVVAPVPWQGFWQCGYMTRRSPLIRFTGTKDGARDAKVYDLSKVRQSMDFLGSTKWRVNSEIVELIDQALQIPDRRIPGIPVPAKLIKSTVGKSVSSGKLQKRTDLLRQLKEKQKLESETPVLLSKLEIARYFKYAPEIYFPHSVDFRGRAYPISAPFNHQGDDISRSMLKFGTAKPLGERGWFWLRVHCANLFGKDKLKLDERVNWFNDNLGEILEVSKNPLSKESIKYISSHTEDFWQALATCLEVRDAVTSGNPLTFESSLPVHQDGSCNGLQHYAALGRDESGARAVNVMHSEKVEDVYSVVLGIVKQRVAEDAKSCTASLESVIKECPSSFNQLKSKDPKVNGILARIALDSENVLQRKTVKQTVMTICYGVTAIGASDQVQKQLDDLPIAKKLTAAQLAILSSYLARLTLSSIDTVFSEAMEIKRWFDKVSAEINKVGTGVNWITPVGFPCRQPYRRSKVTEIRTPVQKITVTTEDSYDKAPISAAKQRMGFPPNFVHSLDASHMILTSLRCRNAGITFASVHDSFWTHAADTDIMNTFIREEFYSMYQEPILERLRDSLVMSLGSEGHKIPPLPKQGTLDLKCVLDSPYFFD